MLSFLNLWNDAFEVVWLKTLAQEASLQEPPVATCSLQEPPVASNASSTPLPKKKPCKLKTSLLKAVINVYY